MAKKISKHSRAARRLEAEEPEAHTLAKLPRVDNVDITNKLIRTATKNEQLLEAKMRKKGKQPNKVGKKQITKTLSNNIDKERLERALNMTSRLDGKVQRAESRAKYVQKARKAGWDTTNENIKKELTLLQAQDKKNDLKAEGPDDVMDEDNLEEPSSSEKTDDKSSNNAFSVLADDVEA